MADDAGYQEREQKKRNSFGRRRRMAPDLDVLCRKLGVGVLREGFCKQVKRRVRIWWGTEIWRVTPPWSKPHGAWGVG